jgi:hypothetical protein
VSKHEVDGRLGWRRSKKSVHQHQQWEGVPLRQMGDAQPREQTPISSIVNRYQTKAGAVRGGPRLAKCLVNVTESRTSELSVA